MFLGCNQSAPEPVRHQSSMVDFSLKNGLILIMFVIIWSIAKEKGDPNDTIQRICSKSYENQSSHKKVISYSFFGNTSITEVKERYFNQIPERLEEAGRWYPGWTVRLYMDAKNLSDRDKESMLLWKRRTPDFEIECLENHPELGRFQGRVWRFHVLVDQSVKAFLSRDLDSSILPREVFFLI